MGKKFTVRLTEQELADLITKHLMDPKGANVLGNFIKGVLGDKTQSSDTPSTSDSKGTSISGNDGTFTDLDLNTSEGYKAYKEIADKFIDSRSANLLGITGSMLADSAKKTFNQYKKYVPAELALAQLATEGGFSSDPKSRPIRTKNPFNVGNVDSGANVQHSSVQSGIDSYYSLIARNYLTGGKTADDLIKNFVNKNNQRYASGKQYEDSVKSIANKVKQISQPIYASITKKSGSSDIA
jgi:formyltetrahydrofolate synthetase